MVFVLDRRQKPLMPCSEKRARLLLERGRAVFHHRLPFTIGMKDRTAEESEFQPLRLKLDPGSKTTGMAIILDGQSGNQAIFFGQVVHQPGIKHRLKARAGVGRGRRQRHTRYRPARFYNRRRPKGWLPPSLVARVDQTIHTVNKILRDTLSVKHVAFDTPKMQDPEIQGVEYQQDALLGYEVREYLQYKWGRPCTYCDATNTQLQAAHIVSPKRGGSDRVSNLTMACPTCNQVKGIHPLEDFLANDQGRRKRARQNAKIYAGKDPVKKQERIRWETDRLERINRQRKTPLRDAAAMNATRWRLYDQLKTTGLPVEGGSVRRTKMQRIALHLPKEHYHDALWVGAITPETFASVPVRSAKGRENRQPCRTDKYGFSHSPSVSRKTALRVSNRRSRRSGDTRWEIRGHLDRWCHSKSQRADFYQNRHKHRPDYQLPTLPCSPTGGWLANNQAVREHLGKGEAALLPGQKAEVSASQNKDETRYRGRSGQFGRHAG